MLLLSPKPHAKILSLDKSSALQMPGVKAVFTAGDLGDQNRIWAESNPVFAKDEVRVQEAYLCIVALIRRRIIKYNLVNLRMECGEKV